jgi:hypothetical protein
MREHNLRLKPGEGVTVLEGALAGADAEMVTAKSVNSVRVLLGHVRRQGCCQRPGRKDREKGIVSYHLIWRYACLRGASQSLAGTMRGKIAAPARKKLFAARLQAVVADFAAVHRCRLPGHPRRNAV